MSHRRIQANRILAYALLLAINLVIAAPLFRVEYSAYLESNEGTFIAVARQVAAQPGDLLWWPEWACGLPFQNTYLPLLPILAGVYARLAQVSAALSYHQLCAALFCLAPVAAFAMADAITRRPLASFFGALLFSLFSPCAWLVPAISTDLGSPWHPRRLQILGYYGEGPHTGSLALLPLAILFLYLSMTRNGYRYRVLAGVFAGLTVLFNAFGAVILFVVCLCLLMTVRTDRFWRNAMLLGAIGGLAYLWISPLAPPSVLAAIRMNSPTVDGDYRFTLRSLFGVFAITGGGAVLWWVTRRLEAHLRFFALYAWCLCGVVLLGALARVFVVPQPHRYQIAMDLGLCLTAVFGARALVSRLGSALLSRTLVAATIVACGAQFVHSVKYARGLIRSTDITRTAPYRIARWMDGNMGGRRVMVSGSYSFHFNDFTNTPQLHGGHDPMLPNFLVRIATFVIYSGMNTGSEDAVISTLWLQALGAHAISVPGPGSGEYYKPFPNPGKFEGVLPVLWREGADTIYGVPARSTSLAHILPEQALVRNPPVNGLDVAEIRRYVAALNDPTMPPAPLVWRNRHQADVQYPPTPGSAVSVQVTYAPGWRAWVQDRELEVKPDGLGFIVVRPQCGGPCTVSLNYDGGPELRWTGLASLMVFLGTGAAALRRGRSRG